MGQLLDCRNHKTHLSGKVLTEIPPIIGKGTFLWVSQHYHFCCLFHQRNQQIIMFNYRPSSIKILKNRCFIKCEKSMFSEWMFGVGLRLCLLQDKFSIQQTFGPNLKFLTKLRRKRMILRFIWITNNSDF